MGGMKNAYKSLFGTPEGERPLRDVDVNYK
jgi:hypothetical protein